MFKDVVALWCQCDQCKHEWLACGLPIRCAKCKSRKWNSEKFSVDLSSVPVAKAQRGVDPPLETDPVPEVVKAARKHRVDPEPDYSSMKPSEALRARREWMAKQ